MKDTGIVNHQKGVIGAVEWDNRGIMVFGKAKCNEKDEFSVSIGEKIASLRAHLKFLRAKEVMFRKKAHAIERQAEKHDEYCKEAGMVAQRWKDVLEVTEASLKG